MANKQIADFKTEQNSSGSHLVTLEGKYKGEI